MDNQTLMIVLAIAFFFLGCRVTCSNSKEFFPDYGDDGDDCKNEVLGNCMNSSCKNHNTQASIISYLKDKCSEGCRNDSNYENAGLHAAFCSKCPQNPNC
jgi:hypothetical protein